MLALIILKGSATRGFPDFSIHTVVLLIGSVFLAFGLWSLYDRIMMSLPSMMHCAVCGTKLPRMQALRNLKGARTRTYPFRLVDGTREEQPVRALCRRCEKRAGHYRERMLTQEELEEEPEVRAPALQRMKAEG